MIEEIKLQQAQLLRNECLKIPVVANIEESVGFEAEHIIQNENIFLRNDVQCLQS